MRIKGIRLLIGFFVFVSIIITIITCMILYPFFEPKDQRSEISLIDQSINRKIIRQKKMELRKKNRAKESNDIKSKLNSIKNIKVNINRGKHKKKKRVRRWKWESSSDARARLWNIPQEKNELNQIESLLRICISEQTGSIEDCVGIWQVLNNIRRRSCDRHVIKNITECDENGETMISVMRRAQRYAIGAVPPRTRRQRWISQLKIDCMKPKNYPFEESHWNNHYYDVCIKTVELAKNLVSGREKRRITSALVIAWGGRCEDSIGACDDPIACSRGLSRVKTRNTANAFWCRPGTRGCSSSIDPVCSKFLKRFN